MATTYSALTQTPSGGLPNRTAHRPTAQYARHAQWYFNAYALTAALVLDDIIEMLYVPKGATVFDAMMYVVDLDTSTGVVFDLGYGTDDDYWIAASTVGQAGGIARAAAATVRPLTFAAADTIDIHVDTAPTGTPTASGTLYVGGLMALGFANAVGTNL